MYIPKLRRIYARVHSPLSSPFPSSSVTVPPVCPSMRLSSPLCTRFDVTILLHIYIFIYIYILCANIQRRRRCSRSCVFIQWVHRCRYPRGTVTLICNSRPPPPSSPPLPLPLAISGSRDGRTDETSTSRDRRMINSFRPNRTSSGLADSDTAFRRARRSMGEDD